jgi:hypothetical protein
MGASLIFVWRVGDSDGATKKNDKSISLAAALHSSHPYFTSGTSQAESDHPVAKKPPRDTLSLLERHVDKTRYTYDCTITYVAVKRGKRNCYRTVAEPTRPSHPSDRTAVISVP